MKALGRNTSSTRSDEQTELAPFWEGNASVHWNQAANQIARAKHLSISTSNRLLAVLNIAMADTAFTIWSAKRHYGAVSDRGHVAADDGDPAGRNRRQSGHGRRRGLAAAGHHAMPPRVSSRPPEPEWRGGDRPSQPLRRCPNVHADDGGRPNRTYTSISQARTDGNNARVWGGMHYPSTVAVSDAVGEAIANYVNLNAMLRIHGRNER